MVKLAQTRFFNEIYKCFIGGISVLFLAFSSHAYAFQQQLDHRFRTEPLPDVYQWLMQQSPDADNRDEFYRHLGRIAMSLGDYSAAISHFEQTVLLAPLDLGTRLELSIAYAEEGNLPAARASLAALYHYAAGHDLPPAAAKRIEELERYLDGGHLAKVRSLVGQLRGTVSVGQGYDSNANQGTSQRIIPLNLWGELPVQLRLTDESMAQSSAYSRVDARFILPWPALPATDGDSGWQLMGGINLLRYHRLEALRQRDVYLGAQWRPPRGNQQFSLFGIQQRQGNIGNRWSFQTGYRRQFGGHLMSSVGLQWQQELYHPSSQTLRTGVWLSWAHAVIWGRASWQFRPGRAAGDTWRAQLGVDSPVWRWHRLGVSGHVSWERRRDTESYNPLFFGDVSRRTDAFSVGVQGRLTLNESLAAVFEAEWEQTEAEIALFEHRRMRLEASLEWRW